MIQFPSDTGRQGGHVGGSQSAADAKIAKTTKDAARKAAKEAAKKGKK